MLPEASSTTSSRFSDAADAYGKLWIPIGHWLLRPSRVPRRLLDRLGDVKTSGRRSASFGRNKTRARPPPKGDVTLQRLHRFIRLPSMAVGVAKIPLTPYRSVCRVHTNRYGHALPRHDHLPTSPPAADPTPSSRERLLDAAIMLIRTEGYTAMRVEDVCAEAGLAKGSFFHHFAGKEDLAMAAAERFATRAAFRAHAEPLQRLLGYIDFRQGAMQGDLAAFTRLVGMLAQETYSTHPQLSEGAGRHIEHHAATLQSEIEAARATHAPDATLSAHSLAMFTQAVIQGAFILTKSQHDPAAATDCLDHLRRYLQMTFAEALPGPIKRRKPRASARQPPPCS